MAATVVALLAACTANRTPGPPAPPTLPALPTPTPIEVSGTPPPFPGTDTTHLVVAATTGSADLGTVTVEPGTVWVTGACTGDHLVLHLQPLADLPLPCGTNEALPFANRLQMRRTTDLTVQVETADDVAWNLRIGQ